MTIPVRWCMSTWKKLGRIPDGGGWRALGRGVRPNDKRGLGYDYVHTAIDDHSRVAYAEIHDDERGITAAGFLDRAVAFYATLGVRIERVITDNAFAYRHSVAFHDVAAAKGVTRLYGTVATMTSMHGYYQRHTEWRRHLR